MSAVDAAHGLLTFYGDDFTGSTDVLLQYHRHGLSGVLFLGVPDPAELAHHATDHEVIGIAGITRSLHADEIRRVLGAALPALAALGPALVQYKICSTADSSPDVGSYAPAIELGRELFGRHPVPVLAAQPNLGRYTAFGHHFAAYGGEIIRLDRQPAMANHPVTPMTESDLRRHIGAQVSGRVGGIDVRALADMPTAVAEYRAADAAGDEALVFDALTEADLVAGAEVLFSTAGGTTAFALGSGGLSTGVAHLRTGRSPAPDTRPERVATPVLAVSGSCSPVTAGQIEWATQHGWQAVPLDTAALVAAGDTAEAELRRVQSAALEALTQGCSVVVQSASGSATQPDLDVAVLGSALASVVTVCRAEAGTQRVLVCGGDTSGHVMLAAGARSLQAVGPVGGQALMCRVLTGDTGLVGAEVVLKGGQIGGQDFFGQVAGDLATHTLR